MRCARYAVPATRMYCNAAFIWRAHSTVPSASGDVFGRTAFTEEDLANDDVATDDMLPWSVRLGQKADGLDAELRRLRYVLLEQPQYLCAKSPSSILPARFQEGSSSCCGSSSILLSPCFRVWKRLRSSNSSSEASSSALAHLPEEKTKQHVLRARSFCKLNYYSTLTLVPKRNAMLSLYTMAWNSVVGVQNAFISIPFYVIREVSDTSASRSMPMRVLRGLRLGVVRALTFLTYGVVVSPLIHIPNGLVNSACGTYSFLTGRLFFAASCGRYFYCDTRHMTHSLTDVLDEMKAIKIIGALEFRRKKMNPDSKFMQQLKAIGFKVGGASARRLKAAMGQDVDDESAVNDPYEILQVSRSSNLQQVKTQYKKLAKVFHPDVVQAQRGGQFTEKEKEAAQRKFESIAEAYQILSNPEKKRAYDNGGRRALKMHESQHGKFAATSAGEMVQNVFGGRVFRETLLGDLYKSHWDLRFQHQISVSMHNLECLQSFRVAILALKLRDILDVHAVAVGHGKQTEQPKDTPSQRVDAKPNVNPKVTNTTLRGGSSPKSSTALDPLLSTSKRQVSADAESSATEVPKQDPCSPSNAFNDFSTDYRGRCTAFARGLSDACFGSALIYDLGDSFTVSSMRFLKRSSFLSPKLFIYRKMTIGFSRLFAGFKAEVAGKSHDELAKMVLVEWFNMEYDNVMNDAVIVQRYAVQVVLQDQSVSETVRARRCYALWYLGQEMMKQGKSFGEGKRDDAELVAYLQQAATSIKSTGSPPRF